MRRTRPLIDVDRIPELFRHRVARVPELVALGLTSHYIYAQCAPAGRWQRLLPGVVLLSDAEPTRAQRIQAALRYAGPGALVTGHDALQLYGMRSAKPGGPVHVLVAHRRQVRSSDAVAVERTTRLPPAALRQGFPVAPLVRAVLDAARRMHNRDGVRAVISESVQRGGLEPAQLRRELAEGSNRGSALARQVLNEVSDGIRSVAEAWARRLILRSGMPRPRWNVALFGPDGTQLAIADAWWDDVALAWEIDSYEWHLSPANYSRTLKRSAALTAAGITVVHTLPVRLRDEPAAVVDELRRAYQHAAARPRPDIRAC